MSLWCNRAAFSKGYHFLMDVFVCKRIQIQNNTATVNRCFMFTEALYLQCLFFGVHAVNTTPTYQ